jgi:diketogulonate reductase-like aldo/keto reductase
MLRWAIQHGTVPIPKSAHPDRIKSNIEIFDFELTAEEMARLDSLSAT